MFVSAPPSTGASWASDALSHEVGMAVRLVWQVYGQTAFKRNCTIGCTQRPKAINCVDASKDLERTLGT
jgi:hypothetical protein